MTSKGNRLDRVSGALTAKERAVLVLRSWQEGRDEDSSWRWSMPREQAVEFNRYIELLNGVNVHLVPLLVVLALEGEKLKLRLGMLGMAALWYVQAANSEGYLEHECPDATLIKASFDYIPRCSVMHLEEELQALLPDEEPTRIDEVIAHQKELLRDSLLEHRGYLLAVEAALAEVGEEFGGVDPTVPRAREPLDFARTLFEEVWEEAPRFLGPLEDAKPDQETVARVRRLVGLEPEPDPIAS